VRELKAGVLKVSNENLRAISACGSGGKAAEARFLKIEK
jgi:hypothetical protein